jgi:ubiquitin carboxyl-terminal hydrolase 20/33
VLCIQLKRFRHESFFSSKVNTYVSFPADMLDMSPFMKDENGGPLKERQGDYYELIGVINHLGSFGGKLR